MGVLDSVINLVPSVIDFGSQLITNRQNLDLQKIQWEREDSAVRRKVNDLEKAGFNKVLAASGAGASSSEPIRLAAPKVDPDIFSKSLQAQAIRGQIAKTLADSNVSQQQSEFWTEYYKYFKNDPYAAQEMAKADALLPQLNRTIKNAETFIKETEVKRADELLKQEVLNTQLRKHDVDILKNLPVPSSAYSGVSATALNAGNLAGSIIKGVASEIRSWFSK